MKKKKQYTYLNGKKVAYSVIKEMAYDRGFDGKHIRVVVAFMQRNGFNVELK